VALFLTSGLTWGLNFAVVLVTLLIFVDCARVHRVKTWYALGYPLGTALFVAILLRTMILNLVQGGISWRGTFYKLEKLKANRV
jgi:bacteriorhodopsin